MKPDVSAIVIDISRSSILLMYFEFSGEVAYMKGASLSSKNHDIFASVVIVSGWSLLASNVIFRTPENSKGGVQDMMSLDPILSELQGVVSLYQITEPLPPASVLSR
ncbi:MAG: Uncharacterised protein [Methanobacteriota archaeon]|nr:MAG: Uncharacterised protein [Euryarchaeota archaeon]